MYEISKLCMRQGSSAEMFSRRYAENYYCICKSEMDSKCITIIYCIQHLFIILTLVYQA